MTITVNVPIERYEQLIAIEKALNEKKAEKVDEQSVFEALSNSDKITYAKQHNAIVETVRDDNYELYPVYRICIFSKYYTVSCE
jgi:hypothetical protein